MDETLDDSSIVSPRGPLGAAIIQTSHNRDADARYSENNNVTEQNWYHGAVS
jgi:hypothetical protein